MYAIGLPLATNPVFQLQNTANLLDYYRKNLMTKE
jgi:hypothetical protein